MNFKTTLIFLAVFIVLGGAYFFFGRPSPDAEQSEVEAQQIRKIYTLNEDRIQRIRLSFQDESYQSLTLVKNAAGVWKLTAPFTAAADTAKVNEMLNALLEKKIKQTLEAADYAQYGLQPPNIQIELWTGGEAPARTFFIGNKTVNYSVYTQEQSESHIFLIESSALDDFTKSPSDLRDRDVFNFSPDAVTALHLRVGSQPEIHCESRIGLNSDTAGDAGEWKMIQPVEAKADTRLIQEILAALAGLKAVVFEADGDYDPANYGLSPPQITVALQFTDDAPKQELQIGSDAGIGGRIYVARPDHHAVYAVNREIYTKLDRTVFDLRDKRIIDFQRTATHRFTLRQREDRIMCQKNVDGEWEITSPVTLKADAAAVDDLLFGVDALKTVAFVDDQARSLRPYGLDSPSIQASFMAPDTEPAVLLVGKTKGDNVYVKSQNADTVFLVKREFLDLVGMGVAELRHKQILDFDSDAVSKISLKHSDVNLACQKQGTNWRLTQPVQEQAKNGAVRSIIQQVNRLTVEAFLPVSPTAATTGFDAPEIQLVVTLKDRTEHRVIVGKPADDTQHYGRLQNVPNTVFLLKKEIVENLTKTVDDLRAIPDEN